MFLKNFEEMVTNIKNVKKSKAVVVAAHDEHTLEAVLKAKDICQAIFFGNKSKIEEILKNNQADLSQVEIIHTESDSESAEQAVKYINEGKADFIIKGKIQTPDLLRAVVNKEKGLRTNKLMSHVALLEFPSYHKILAIVDGGMVLLPDLQKKIKILENTVEVFHSLGYKEPKVAVVSAMDQVSPDLPETVDAQKLKEMNQSGQIKDCIVEGPISYDLSVNKEVAKIKGFESPVAGEADILLVPNISTGNILSKALYESAGGNMAGIIVGAKVPIVLNSRGASTEEKYYSIVLAASNVKK